MQNLGNQFDSGAFTAHRARIASYFNAMGASPDTVSAVAGGSLPAIEGYGKLAFESTLNQIKSFSTRPAAQMEQEVRRIQTGGGLKPSDHEG